MFGIVNLYKPKGISSRAALDEVKRLCERKTKLGHAGTLDPLAEGVLVCCLGQATRLIEHVQRFRKTYAAEFLLGRASDTDDIEGQVTILATAPQPTRDEIEAQAAKMVGQIMQRPPAFSALKVAGRRAYDLARAGEVVELAQRPVQIFSLRVTQYEYPRLRLEIECGSGTYVRAVGRDLAEALKTGAVMSGLVRTAIGPFLADAAVRIDALRQEGLAPHLLPANLAVSDLPVVVLSPVELARVACGQFVENRFQRVEAEAAAIDEVGRLAAILTPRADGKLGASLCFLRQDEAE